jgi:hypothetical protein
MISATVWAVRRELTAVSVVSMRSMRGQPGRKSFDRRVEREQGLGVDGLDLVTFKHREAGVERRSNDSSVTAGHTMVGQTMV